MIEVENLTKHFGKFSAVNDVSFKVDKGDIVGFLGPNGAGKSTIMRILACFFPPTSGSARVAGYDVMNDSFQVIRNIGYFIEKAPLYTDMTVKSFLNFAAEARGVIRGEKKTRISRVMDECSINKVARKYIKTLSRGYRQRVGLAQTLLHDPKVLILDEPTIGLDPEQVSEVRKLIKNLDSERTVLMSTHILHDVSAICGRIIIINNGKILALDTPKNLMEKVQKHSGLMLKVEGPSKKVCRELKGVPGVIHVEEKGESSPNVFQYLVESDKKSDLSKVVSSVIFNNNWGLLEMKPVVMTLEEIFLKVVSGKN